MSYKTVAALAFTSMFSISTLLSPAYAEEQEKALNFGIISTESQQNLKRWIVQTARSLPRPLLPMALRVTGAC